MERVGINQDLKISKIIHGHWRLAEWKLTRNELLRLIKGSIDLGITTFDEADIYGNYTCEKLFGDSLALDKAIRKEIEIISKCGIKIVSEKFPDRKAKSYDYSFKHIIFSVEQSLKNLRTDYLDVLLLHRPSPYINPAEVARAFEYLKVSGKVLAFGVSNFNPLQFEMLNSYLDKGLITNQVEISPYNLEHFENGNVDCFLKNKIHPMAWSPLAGGKLLKPSDEKSIRINKCLIQIAEEMEIESIDKLIYAWLFSHPCGIIPIVGSSKIERIKLAKESIGIKLSTEHWFRIYSASTGVKLP